MTCESTGEGRASTKEERPKERAWGLTFLRNIFQGTRIINWEPARLPSGVYYLRLEFGGQVLTRRMALVR